MLLAFGADAYANTHTHIHTHTHTHTQMHTNFSDKSNFKKPGAQWTLVGMHLVLKT